MTAINLAFSFARQKDTRTVLMDVDMRKPMVAEDLGISSSHSMGKFLSGASGVQENFLSYSETLAIGTNNRRSCIQPKSCRTARPSMPWRSCTKA